MSRKIGHFYRNFLRRIHKRVVFSAATLLFAASGCNGSCVTKEKALSYTPNSSWERRRDAKPPLIPKKTPWVVQGRALDLQKFHQLLHQEIETYHFPNIVNQLERLTLPVSDVKTSLQALGLRTSTRLTIAAGEHETVVAFRVHDREKVEEEVARWRLSKQTKLTSISRDSNSLFLVSNNSQETDRFTTPYLFTLVEEDPNKGDGTWLFAAIPHDSDLLAGGRPTAANETAWLQNFSKLIEKWSNEPGKWADRFDEQAQPDHLEILYADLYATLNLSADSAFAANLTSSPVWQELKKIPQFEAFNDSNQELAARINFDAEHQKLICHFNAHPIDVDAQNKPLRSSEESTLEKDLAPKVDAEQPKVSPEKSPEKLGRPNGTMPYFSTLAPKGTLAIAHLAFDPKHFFSFAKSLLPKKARDEFETRLQALKEENLFDVERDFVENLDGHITAFIYGLSNDVFRHVFKGSLTDVLLLKDARKAIVLPFKDNIRMVEFLDIATALFPHNFVRKGYGTTDLEYVWHDGDLVLWGLLIKETTMIYVDSSQAYEHAKAFDGTSVSTLTTQGANDPLSIANVEREMKRFEDESSFYLNLEGLSGLLRQDSYYASYDAWFRPFSSVLLFSNDASDELDLRVELYLKQISEPDLEGALPIFNQRLIDPRPQ